MNDRNLLVFRMIIKDAEIHAIEVGFQQGRTPEGAVAG
jgi:hypothetical protein